MESGEHINGLDTYEDMFKEITRKLYGEDLEHRTSNVQNEFETSVSYKIEDEIGQGIDANDEGSWIFGDEPLKGTEGSRVAAYKAATSTWRCYECGLRSKKLAEHSTDFFKLESQLCLNPTCQCEQFNSSTRDVALHFFNSHVSSITAEDKNSFLRNTIGYLDQVKESSIVLSSPVRRTQETQTVTQEVAERITPFCLYAIQQLQSSNMYPSIEQQNNNVPDEEQVNIGESNQMNIEENNLPHMSLKRSSSEDTEGEEHLTNRKARCEENENAEEEGTERPNPSSHVKKYRCETCDYSSDRKDLYNRHLFTHAPVKPYSCYICSKRFNRADHTKKHFERIHKGYSYNASMVTKNLHLDGNDSQDLESLASMSPPSTSSSPRVGSSVSPLNINALSPPEVNLVSLPGSNGNNNIMVLQQQIQQEQEVQIIQDQQNENGSLTDTANAKLKKKTSNSKFKCPDCHWMAKCKWSVSRHFKTHTEPWRCQFCEYKAARPNRLVEHVRQAHKKAQCSKCEFYSDTEGEVKVHEETVNHMNPDPRIAAAELEYMQKKAAKQAVEQHSGAASDDVLDTHTAQTVILSLLDTAVVAPTRW